MGLINFVAVSGYSKELDKKAKLIDTGFLFGYSVDMDLSNNYYNIKSTSKTKIDAISALINF